MILEVLSGSVAKRVEVETFSLPAGTATIRTGNVDPDPGRVGLWVQTGLGSTGTDFTMWIEDGQ